MIVCYAGRKEPADQIVGEIRKTGGNAFAIQADVRNSAERKNLFDQGSRVLAKNSAIGQHLLVNGGATN